MGLGTAWSEIGATNRSAASACWTLLLQYQTMEATTGVDARGYMGYAHRNDKVSAVE